MATITGTQTLTVDAVARAYAEAVHSAYAKQLAQGNTRVKIAPVSDGESILRYSHDMASSNGLERHVISLEDRVNDDATPGDPDIIRWQLTVTLPAGTPALDSRAILLAQGFLAWINDAGRLADIINGIL